MRRRNKKTPSHIFKMSVPFDLSIKIYLKIKTFMLSIWWLKVKTLILRTLCVNYRKN